MPKLNVAASIYIFKSVKAKQKTKTKKKSILYIYAVHAQNVSMFWPDKK